MTLFFRTICLLFPAFMLLAQPMPAVAGPELPTPAGVVLSRAQELMENNAGDRALELILDFQARGGKDPDPTRPDPRGYHHPEVYFFIGNIHFMDGDYIKAEAAYGHALKRDPDHIHARLNLARVHFEQGEYAQSAGHFLKAYESADSKEPEYLYYAAVTSLMADDIESSLSAFDRLVHAHPDQIKPEWRENLVHALLSGDRTEDALFHIILLSETYDGDKRIQWQEMRLYQYLQMDMTDRAEAYALALTREAPANERWWKALAHVALFRNHYENALVALTIYSYLTPLTRDEKKLLADLNLHMGIPALAAPSYEVVMAEKPDKTVLQNLAIAYQQIQQQEKALAAIAAFDGYGDDPDLMMLKADILYAMARHADAAGAYRKAAQNNGRETGRAHLMAGYAAWHLGDIAMAREAFKAAAAFDNQKKAAKAALEQLGESG